MTARQDDTTSKALLDQQRVLAEFGEFALRAENLDGILNEACRLVGDALRTDLAKVAELLPDGKGMLVRAGVGWKPGRGSRSKTLRSSHLTSGASNAWPITIS
jgi:hypothetical protein